MADPLDDIERLLKRMREVSQSDAAMHALLGSINQALQDGVALLEKQQPVDMAALGAQIAGAIKAMPAPQINVAAPQVTVQAAKGSDWTQLRVTAPMDVYGKPTGEMTITKVK